MSYEDYENNNYEENGEDYIESEDEKMEEFIKKEYYHKTLYIIQYNLLNHINSKSLPIAEFLTLSNIDKFISKYIN